MGGFTGLISSSEWLTIGPILEDAIHGLRCLGTCTKRGISSIIFVASESVVSGSNAKNHDSLISVYHVIIIMC